MNNDTITINELRNGAQTGNKSSMVKQFLMNTSLQKYFEIMTSYVSGDDEKTIKNCRKTTEKHMKHCTKILRYTFRTNTSPPKNGFTVGQALTFAGKCIGKQSADQDLTEDDEDVIESVGRELVYMILILPFSLMQNTMLSFEEEFDFSDCDEVYV